MQVGDAQRPKRGGGIAEKALGRRVGVDDGRRARIDDQRGFGKRGEGGAGR